MRFIRPGCPFGASAYASSLLRGVWSFSAFLGYVLAEDFPSTTLCSGFRLFGEADFGRVRATSGGEGESYSCVIIIRVANGCNCVASCLFSIHVFAYESDYTFITSIVFGFNPLMQGGRSPTNLRGTVSVCSYLRWRLSPSVVVYLLAQRYFRCYISNSGWELFAHYLGSAIPAIIPRIAIWLRAEPQPLRLSSSDAFIGMHY